MNPLKSLALAAVAVAALVVLPAVVDAQSRGGGHSGGGAGHSRPAGAPVRGAAVPVHGGGGPGGHPGGPVYGSPNHGYYPPHGYYRPYYPYYPAYGYPYYGYPCCYGPGFSFSIGFGYGPYAYAPYGYGAYGYGWGYGPYAYGGSYYGNGRPYGGVRIDVPQRDAEVFADGYYLGTVDDFDGFTQQANLEPGPHRIEVRRQGFEPMSFDVNVAVGQTVRYRASLRPSQP